MRELRSFFFFFSSVYFSCLLTDQTAKIILVDTLVHPSNKPVDLVFPVASISTFYKMGGHFLHSTWWRQFKGPQEVVCFFETFSNGIDLMNQILLADDSVFPKRPSNQCGVCQGNSLFVHFAITTLVDQFIYRLQIRLPPCNVWLHNSQHVNWCLVELHKGAIENLREAKELQHLSKLWLTPYLWSWWQMPIWVLRVHRSCRLFVPS